MADTAMNRPTVLTVDEAAAIARVKPRQIYGAVARGEIQAVRFGRLIRIPAESFARFLKAAGQ